MVSLKGRFIAVYLVLGATVFASWFAAYRIATLHVPAHVAHLSDIQRIERELGPTKLAALERVAEQQIAAEAQAQQLTVVSQKVVKVKKPSPAEVDIYIDLKVAEVPGVIHLGVAFSKGVYQISAIQQVG